LNGDKMADMEQKAEHQEMKLRGAAPAEPFWILTAVWTVFLSSTHALYTPG